MRWFLQDAKNRFSAVVDTALRQGPRAVTRRARGAVSRWRSAMTGPTLSHASLSRRAPRDATRRPVSRWWIRVIYDCLAVFIHHQ